MIGVGIGGASAKAGGLSGSSNPTWHGSIANSRLQEALALHFDERHGAPFWIERGRELGFDPRREIHEIADLVRLGPFSREWLLSRPLADFVPRSVFEEERTELILAETGGTTGRPVRAVFTPDEFVEAFGAPFTAVSYERKFPLAGAWLFLGPSGPHVIAQAARLLARLHGSLEPFAVDLDPRFARAQEAGSLGEAVYREHVIGQALDILDRESIDVLFVTPPLALALARELAPERRERIRGIHLGGMPVAAAARATLQSAFPRAVIIPAYGNSLFGILPEVRDPLAGPVESASDVDYFPLDGRLNIEIVTEAPSEPAGVDITRAVATGERGRVMFTRLDRSCFLPNVVERDTAVRLIADDSLRSRGFGPIGARNPMPVIANQAARGLY